MPKYFFEKVHKKSALKKCTIFTQKGRPGYKTSAKTAFTFKPLNFCILSNFIEKRITKILN